MSGMRVRLNSQGNSGENEWLSRQRAQKMGLRARQLSDRKNVELSRPRK
jgi:hypothetical protein